MKLPINADEKAISCSNDFISESRSKKRVSQVKAKYL
jgi:hypothetical protein